MKHIKKVCIFTLVLYSSLIAEEQNPRIQAEISYGELVDKISILQIKSERITDPNKLKNIFTELKSLLITLKNHVGNRTDIAELMQELKKVNETLWDIEDMLRMNERIKDFSEEFIQLARGVYITNDQRFTLKKKIDNLLGSYISEEKSFESYI